MAVVDIPKPHPGQEAPTALSVIPTAAYAPNVEVVNAAVWMPPYLAETLGGTLEAPLRGLFVNDPAAANIRLEVGDGNIVSQWVYALVTPFSSTLQGLSGDDLLLRWLGVSTGISLLMDQSTHDMFTALWGPAGANVLVLAKDELVDYAWAHQPALGIIPFNDLDPRWKVLPVDGLSPIHKGFDLGSYRLKIPISLDTDPELASLIRSNFAIPSSNLDPSKMTVVAMTGVTALVRATAATMERRGNLYPAQDIRQWLVNADITHISNEVPVYSELPEAQPHSAGCPFLQPGSLHRIPARYRHGRGRIDRRPLLRLGHAGDVPHA